MAFKILRIGSLLYFLQKLGCSLKKKKKKKVFTLISSLISLYSPKIKVFSEKKKKKVFPQNHSLHSEQTSAAD